MGHPRLPPPGRAARARRGGERGLVAAAFRKAAPWEPPTSPRVHSRGPRVAGCGPGTAGWRTRRPGGGGHPVAHRASLVGSGDLGPTESVQELTGAEPRTLSAERAVSGGVDAANPSGSGLTAGDTWDEATLKFPRKGMCVGRKKDPGPHPGSACCQPCGFGGDLAPAVPRFPHPLLESCYGEGFDV